MAKKIDLAKEAKAMEGAVQDTVTEEILLEHCPKEAVAAFKKAKTPAQRADLLYTIEEIISRQNKVTTEYEKFTSKLEQWFVEQLPTTDATGIAGKVGRVAIETKDIATVADWPTFYAHIKKKGEFELLNRAVNQKAVKERWEQNKQVPGVGKFTKKIVRLTRVK